MTSFDVIVVGSGMAGLNAALSVAEESPDLQVLIISKTQPPEVHTAIMKGISGIVGTNVDWRIHARDTIEDGAYLSDQDVVEVMCQEASVALERLIRIGAPFRRHLVGHYGSKPYHTPDITGKTALAVLWKALDQKPNVSVLAGWRVIDLLKEDGSVTGVRAWNELAGKIVTISSSAVILATGGVSGLYEVSTANRSYFCGDGLVLAFRVGASLCDMEMLQFHPTVLRNGTLILESARSVGAVLRNGNGETFMDKYSPRGGEATRDVIGRAILTEVEEGRGLDGDAVLLDFRGIHPDAWRMNYIKETRDLCLATLGIDIKEGPIPVTTGVHYLMGGIRTDSLGGTGVPGLFAVGHTACPGVHGANRISGNSMLDACVFGMRAGYEAARRAEAFPPPTMSDVETEMAGPFEIGQSDLQRLTAIQCSLRHIMTIDVGIRRNREGLTRAMSTIRDLRRFADSRGSMQGNAYLDTINLLTVAELIALSSLARTESRGAHFRTDFPFRDDDNWLKHVVISRTDQGDFSVSYQPVTITRWLPAAQ